MLKGCADMSNFDNLVAKITGDGEERAKSIIGGAEAKAKEIIAAKLEKAEKEKLTIEADAKVQAKNTKEKIILAAKLKARDDVLDAKRDVIDKVCAEALARLSREKSDNKENVSYEALLRYYRDEVEDLVVQNLF
jgi:V/A-type H+-transporting ATPase subunit E